jgi:cell wall-associated NlpC family hydrolase
MTNKLKRNIFLTPLFVLLLVIISAFKSNSNTFEYLGAPDNDSTNIEGTTIDKRAELIASANNYLGSKYRYNASGPKAFDCSGFTSFVYSNFGMELDRSSRAQARHGKRIPISSAQPGDLVFFAVKGNIHHVGIIVKNEADELWMIHSSTSRGVIIEEIYGSAYWRKRLLFAKDVLSDFTYESTTDNQIDTF